MASFEITVGASRVALSAAAGGAYAGSTTFTVKNLLDHRVEVRGSVTASDPSKPEWFAVDGEKTLETSASVTFTVKVTIPAGTPAVEYPFRPVAASVADPSNESDVGPPVIVTLKPEAKSLWWIWAAVAGGVVVLGGAIALIVMLLHRAGPAPSAPDAAPRSGCDADADCPPAKKLCIRHACQAPVANGKDCQESRECESGNCFHAACSPPGTCVSDGDCQAPKTCNKNLCSLRALDEACAANAQCATGRCVHNRCSDPLQCSNNADCTGKICLFDWCRDPSLHELKQLNPGNGPVAKMGSVIDVRAHFHVNSPLPIGDRDETATLDLGHTVPHTLTDVFLGLAPGGVRRLDRLPDPPPWMLPPSAAPFAQSISAEFQLIRIK